MKTKSQSFSDDSPVKKAAKPSGLSGFYFFFVFSKNVVSTSI